MSQSSRIRSPQSLVHTLVIRRKTAVVPFCLKIRCLSFYWVQMRELQPFFGSRSNMFLVLVSLIWFLTCPCTLMVSICPGKLRIGWLPFYSQNKIFIHLCWMGGAWEMLMFLDPPRSCSHPPPSKQSQSCFNMVPPRTMHSPNSHCFYNPE